MSFRRGLRLAGFARRHLGRMNEGRSAVLAHLSAPRADNLPMPTFVQLRVTNLCNLRCKMCGQWGDTGIFRLHSGSNGATDGARERDRIRELIGAETAAVRSPTTRGCSTSSRPRGRSSASSAASRCSTRTSSP